MKSILTDDQRRLLEAIGADQALSRIFYLTGGTPLAAFYLGHRYSEDLDFFSDREVETAAINVFFRRNRSVLGITTIDFEQSYNRNLFFLHRKRGVLKTEFTYFPFPRIEQGPTRFGIVVDSLYDIAVNKLFTIYQRTAARDYLDLYCICRKQRWSIGDLVKKAKVKFDWHIDPIQLGSQFIKVTDAKDEPRMIKKLSRGAWENFFIKEAKRLKGEIFEE